MSISLTENAAKHVAGQLTARGHGIGIRVGVKTTGCSGMAYVLEFVDEVQPEDQVFEDHGVKVFIDPKSMVYLDGTELDVPKSMVPQQQFFVWLWQVDICSVRRSHHVAKGVSCGDNSIVVVAC